MARTSKESASKTQISVTQMPALSPEEREQQMISLATTLAERQLREGTASSQVITHYLKLGTLREQEELEKIRKENELLEAKRETLKNAVYTKELVEEAIESFKTYAGGEDSE